MLFLLKSLSLPGERIGYVLIPDAVQDFADTYAAVCGAGRVLGYVNAPSLFQRVAARCAGQTSDLSVYAKNRDLLYGALTAYGYDCVKPQGAFYIFPQTLGMDDYAFCEKAKQYDLLVVPGTDFGAPAICASPTASRPRPSSVHCRSLSGWPENAGDDL